MIHYGYELYRLAVDGIVVADDCGGQSSDSLYFLINVAGVEIHSYRVTLISMKSSIISVGNELITGQVVDTNAAWIASKLMQSGVQIISHQTVGDDVDRLSEMIRQSWDRSTLIIITGGLGPTPDDRTRFAIAAAFDLPLEEHAEAVAQLRTMFKQWQRTMHDSNLVQAMIPKDCEILANQRGTAPGITYHHDDRYLFALPGVPCEMKDMFDQHIQPMISSRCSDTCSLDNKLLCFGISEARLGELLSDLMREDRNPQVGITASEAVMSIRIVAKGQTRSEAKNLLDKDTEEVRRRLGSAIFSEGDDTLQHVVGRLLMDQKKTISTAESCTGGLLGKYLTDVPGSSSYFIQGYITYSNESKAEILGVPMNLISTEGSVSESVALAMADGCIKVAHTDYAISITGIAGPDGGNPPEKPIGLIYIAIACENNIDSHRFTFGQHLTRSEVRDRSCKTALNLLRHRLMGTDTS